MHSSLSPPSGWGPCTPCTDLQNDRDKTPELLQINMVSHSPGIGAPAHPRGRPAGPAHRLPGPSSGGRCLEPRCPEVNPPCGGQNVEEASSLGVGVKTDGSKQELGWKAPWI